MEYLNRISYKGKLIAIIIRVGFKAEGVDFITPNDFSQQLAFIGHPKGKVITPHIHNPVNRSVKKTLEVLFIRKGKVRIDFYTQSKKYLQSQIIGQGDVILLASGGHGFEMLEDVEMIEVKQGPYAGEADKTRFKSIPSDKMKLNKLHHHE